MRESAFWRFMLFLVILIGVRLVFEHQSQIYPKYWQRTIPEHLFRAEAGPVGALQNESVPPAIRAGLAHAGITLSAYAVVEIEKRGVRWLIRDEEQRLRIERTYTLGVSRIPDAPEGEHPPAWLTPELGLTEVQQLQGGQVPAPLREEFAGQQHSLSETPSIDLRARHPDYAPTRTISDGGHTLLRQSRRRSAPRIPSPQARRGRRQATHGPTDSHHRARRHPGTLDRWRTAWTCAMPCAKPSGP